MIAQPAERTAIAAAQWRAERQLHFDVIRPFTASYRKRRARGGLHPIYDFLFQYYTLSTAKLEKWRPGYGAVLEPGEERVNSDLLSDTNYTMSPEGITLSSSAIHPKHIKQLLWIRSLCKAILGRESRFTCYGLHEWAMTYRTSDIRHQYPLRLSAEEIARVVDSTTYCCSHFDAFRFSSPAARGLNVLQPTSQTLLKFEQGGCVHANMDLYKWAYKLIPLVPSSLLRDCFLLACETREIDMRASPYDFTSLGFAPITIETEAGRDEYRHAQQSIAERAVGLRTRLLDLIDRVLADIPLHQIAEVRRNLEAEHYYA